MGAHTPGPWAWFGNAGSNSVYLATQHSGRRFVMDFVRWGFKGAQPRFQPDRRGAMVEAKSLLQFEVGDKSIVGIEAASKDSSVYRLDIRGIDCADARLIAAAPELLGELKRMVQHFEAWANDWPEVATTETWAALHCSKAAIAKAEGTPTPNSTTLLSAVSAKGE